MPLVNILVRRALSGELHINNLLAYTNTLPRHALYYVACCIAVSRGVSAANQLVEFNNSYSLLAGVK